MAKEKTDIRSTADSLVSFIRGLKEDTGCKGFVVGLSGGLDSAVVTKLAVDAVGGDNVLNIFMPVDSTPKADYDITTKMSDMWGTRYKVINIQSVVDPFVKITDSEDRMDIGNIAARSRMTILFNEARKNGYIVLGTSNKSELMMGYFTKFGDGACDAMPICNLFKTQVRSLAKEIGVPAEVISKPPTAGLWEGQTDESDMQITYDDLDRILAAVTEGNDPMSVISDTISKEDVQRIVQRVDAMKHKSSPPYRPSI